MHREELLIALQHYPAARATTPSCDLPNVWHNALYQLTMTPVKATPNTRSETGPLPSAGAPVDALLALPTPPPTRCGARCRPPPAARLIPRRLLPCTLPPPSPPNAREEEPPPRVKGDGHPPPPVDGHVDEGRRNGERLERPRERRRVHRHYRRRASGRGRPDRRSERRKEVRREGPAGAAAAAAAAAARCGGHGQAEQVEVPVDAPARPAWVHPSPPRPAWPTPTASV